MKKKGLALFVTLATLVSMTACSDSDADMNQGNGVLENESIENGVSGSGTAQNQNGAHTRQDVVLRMWGAEEDQAMLQSMIDTFVKEYADVANIKVELGVESESTAKDTILTDMEAAADVYAFASDQLNDLVKAGALQSIDEMSDALLAYTGKSTEDIKAANMPNSVEAAMVNGELYGFPMSADNGYFLYYDANIISPKEAQSWDTLLDAAEDGGKKVGMVLASGWYNASFFYGAGFETGLNEDGTTAINFNGMADYTGVQVVQSMLDIAEDSAFMAIAEGDIANRIASGALAAVVSGTWDATAAQKAFGEGYAATKLPTFTCAGEQVQQGSVAGYKLVGVNAYSENAGWAALLGDWITNEENQMIRFETREIGPSNVNVAASEAVNANVAITALAEQNQFGKVQIVGGNYWDPAATLGQIVAEGALDEDDEQAIQKALDTMVAGASAPIG